MANLVTTIDTCDRQIPKLVAALDGLLGGNPEQPEANLGSIHRAIDAVSIMQLELIGLAIAVAQYEARKAAREARKGGC